MFASVAKMLVAPPHEAPPPPPPPEAPTITTSGGLHHTMAGAKGSGCIIGIQAAAAATATSINASRSRQEQQRRQPEERTHEPSIISCQPIVIASSSSEPRTLIYQRQQQQQLHHLDDLPLPLPLAPPPASLPQLPPGGLRTNQNHHNNPSSINPAASAAAAAAAAGGGQWMVVAAQTTQGMRHRMSLASDQLGISLRQLYASASSITDVPPSYHNIPGIVPYYHGRSSGPPPSYDDVINPYAPPPTYQSLFGQMREARKTSRGLLDLLQRLLIILISTLGCTILIAFMILIPFTMIIVGAVYIDECRVEHIPAFLLVGGLVWASKNIIHCYAQCQHPLTVTEPPPSPSEFSSSSSSNQSTNQQAAATTTIGVSLSNNQEFQANQTTRQQSIRLKSSICESLLNCVLFGWFVAGCVIVFRNYEPDFENQDSLRYCHRTVYMYTFWLITSAIIISSLFIGCICCLMVSSAIAGRQEDDLA